MKALPYLKQFQPQGRVFNDCLWGGYLVWNARNIPVFIDSRIDIYEYNGVFADYLDALGIKKTLEILNKYHIRYVLYPQESPVAYLLLHNTGWKTKYEDGTTVLLERIGGVTCEKSQGVTGVTAKTGTLYFGPEVLDGGDRFYPTTICLAGVENRHRGASDRLTGR